MSRKTPTIYAFIDSQNLNLGVRDQGWKLDFGRFRVYLKDKYKVEKAFLFIGYIPKYKKLYSFLKKVGYKIVFKPVVVSEKDESEVKGNVDAELVLHSMIELPKYNKAVLVSGEGDFYCLAEYLEQQGKLLKIIVPNSHYSSLLRRFAGFIVNIQLFRDKIQKKRGIPAG